MSQEPKIRQTEIIPTIFGGWAIVYRLDNGFPIVTGPIYQYRWMARFKKWWVEDVHKNYIGR